MGLLEILERGVVEERRRMKIAMGSQGLKVIVPLDDKYDIV